MKNHRISPAREKLLRGQLQSPKARRQLKCRSKKAALEESIAKTLSHAHGLDVEEFAFIYIDKEQKTNLLISKAWTHHEPNLKRMGDRLIHEFCHRPRSSSDCEPFKPQRECVQPNRNLLTAFQLGCAPNPNQNICASMIPARRSKCSPAVVRTALLRLQGQRRP